MSLDVQHYSVGVRTPAGEHFLAPSPKQIEVKVGMACANELPLHDPGAQSEEECQQDDHDNEFQAAILCGYGYHSTPPYTLCSLVAGSLAIRPTINRWYLCHLRLLPMSVCHYLVCSLWELAPGS